MRPFTLGVGIFLALLALVAVAVAVDPDIIENLVAEDPARLPIGGGLLMVPLVWISLLLFRIGSEARRTQSFLPPSTLTRGDEPTLVGAKAVRRGRMLQLLSVALVILSVLVPIILWKLAGTIERAA